MPDSIPPTPWVNQWSEVRPVTLIGKRRAYFEIPAFDIDDVEDLGTSFIVGVFNYVAVRNLTLRNLPELPEDVNYIPCIKYRLDDGTVYRYKLWEVEGDEVYYPVYNGELILKNFQIEIWVLPSETSVNNDAAITINNSIVVNRSDNFIPTQSDTVEEPEDEDIVTDLNAAVTVEFEANQRTFAPEAGNVQNFFDGSGDITFAPGFYHVRYALGAFEYNIGSGNWRVGTWTVYNNLTPTIHAIGADTDFASQGAVEAAYPNAWDLIDNFSVAGSTFIGLEIVDDPMDFTLGSPPTTIVIQSSMDLPMVFTTEQHGVANS